MEPNICYQQTKSYYHCPIIGVHLMHDIYTWKFNNYYGTEVVQFELDYYTYI